MHEMEREQAEGNTNDAMVEPTTAAAAAAATAAAAGGGCDALHSVVGGIATFT